jgi:hypothetical protein
MCIDELYKGTQKNRKGLATTGGRVYETTPAFMDGLPGLFLEKKGVPAVGR